MPYFSNFGDFFVDLYVSQNYSKRLVIGMEIEPAHDKTHNKTCATSEYSVRPAHSRSPIRVFADHMCLLQLQAIQKGINKNPCHTGWMCRLT